MGRLYVVPTPIGNLEDITFRALRVLREVDLILAEDTRHTAKLLSHYGILTPMLSYHEHNRHSRMDRVIAAVTEGDVALVSDAGTPGIADPGCELIAEVVARGLSLDVLPGPSAVTTAVVLSAVSSPGFLFVGFLPRTSSDRRKKIAALRDLPYSVVLYEAPHRLMDLLQDILQELGDRHMVAVRELTKVHQEVVRGPVSALIARYGVEIPRGEFSLVLAGAEESRTIDLEGAMGHLRRRKAEGARASDAVDEVVGAMGIRRNEAYRLWVDIPTRD